MAHHKLLTPLLVLLIVGLLCTQIESKATKNTQTSHTIDSGKLYIQVKQTSNSSP